MIQYIGGKYHQAKWMSGLAPRKFKSYAECFGGAMWFYVKSNITNGCEVCYYNDFDPYMYNLFLCFKQYDEMIDRMKDLPATHNETFNKMKNVIQKEKKKFEAPDMDVAVAQVYMVTHMFSGITSAIIKPKLKMLRTKGYKFTHMTDHSVLTRLRNPDIRQKLDKLKVSNMSYEEFIPTIDHKGLFLYLDPPYWKTESYYKKGDFNYEDHERLASILEHVKCKWMLSYYDYPELNEWYPRKKYVWKRKEFRKMSAVKRGEKMKDMGEEVNVLNYGKEQDKLATFFGG